MMMKPRTDGSLPCWPIVPDNDGKTNGGQREWQRGSPMGNATKRKAQSRAMALYCPAPWLLPFPPTSSLICFLSRSCRLIRKFRGKETKEGGRGRSRERRRLGFRCYIIQNVPLRDETPLRHRKTSECELLTTREVPKRVTRNN